MKTKCERTHQLRRDEETGQLVLAITEVSGARVRKTTRTHYRVEKNPNHPRAFRLAKLTFSDEPGEVYDVLADGEDSTCDCLGFLQHGHRGPCRHIEAIECLLQEGKL